MDGNGEALGPGSSPFLRSQSTKEVGHMSKKRLATILVACLLGTMVIAGNALASTSSAKDCSVCQFKPAIPTTTTTKSSSSTSKTHIRVVKSLRAQIKQYEQVTHRVVTIDQQPGGIKSFAGCVDPVQKDWIQSGGQFSNTRYKGGAGRFWDRWHAGLSICHPHRIKWNGGYWMEGTKSNCGNEKIRIQVSGPRTIHKIIPVVRFRTVKSFRSTYDKWITKTTTSTSTGTTTTTFSCDAYGSGWTLTTERGSSECKSCPPAPCPTPTPPAKAHGYLSKVALKDGAIVALSGGEFTYSINLNGSSSGSTTNAASGSNRDLGQFNGGDSVTVCETNPGGYTPDQVCISHTFTAGESYTFPFVNRKTTPPPSNVAPSCSNVTSPQNGANGIYADGETYPGQVTATGKSGSSLVLTFSSTYGSFTNGPIAFTSNGVDVKGWTYKAPNDPAVYGKFDQIFVTVTDTATGLSSTCHSDPFVLNAPPAQV